MATLPSQVQVLRSWSRCQRQTELNLQSLSSRATLIDYDPDRFTRDLRTYLIASLMLVTNICPSLFKLNLVIVPGSYLTCGWFNTITLDDLYVKYLTSHLGLFLNPLPLRESYLGQSTMYPSYFFLQAVPTTTGCLKKFAYSKMVSWTF
jgi:hypothetical protein